MIRVRACTYDGGARVVAAGRGSPNLESRSAGSRPSPSVSESVPHLADPFSVYAAAGTESPLRLQSTTQTATLLSVVRTSPPDRWLPCPLAPGHLVPPTRDRTSRLPRDAAIVSRETRHSLCQATQSAETRGENLLL